MTIPSVERAGNAEQFIFIWGLTTQAIQMRTQLDEIEPTTGYCTVDKAIKRIVALTFGRRPII
ncbi:hypothetical protein [Polaromonas sp. SM01]|uniref:hypothetical protein n=1 Tax=Polaromonas sp. SM01 TaxID=3085630 RepID=UPI0029829EFA|nr:hypothetical protein [Polaromonas sp. SM01]MDW5443936.1 hypothetical protein [Polaromonas sp. SM01]